MSFLAGSWSHCWGQDLRCRVWCVTCLSLACLPLAPQPSDAEAIWRSMPAWQQVGEATGAYPGRFVAYLKLGRTQMVQWQREDTFLAEL